VALVGLASALAAGVDARGSLGPLRRAGAAPAATGTGTASGTAYRDLDGDGQRDAGEPGVANVVVAKLGTSSRAVTGADGRWSVVLPVGTHTLEALTGWLPSACPGDLHCLARRTADQDFAVENQFVRAKVTVVAGSAITGLDLGLSPDHGDPTGSATSMHAGNDPGDGSARTHDLAVRHSGGGYAGCTDPAATRRCPVGTQLTFTGQLFNQGTAWVSGVRFVVTVPIGTSLVRDPVLDVNTPGIAPVRTGRTGTTADGGRWYEFDLGRSLPPAAAVWFRTVVKITAGPATPTPIASGSYSRRSFVAVAAVTPTDNDAPLRVDPTVGLDRGHNVNWPKRLDDDTSDSVDWNVA
jgi:hypothetical protein